MELSDQLSDSALLDLIRQNNLYAFKRIYGKYWKELFLKACKRVDENIAKDLVQEVMITLWRRRSLITTDKNDSIAPYLHTALKYRIIAYYAYTAAEIRKFEAFVPPSELVVSNDLELKELKDLIEREVCKLPQKMQKIFRMSREEDISIKEIASQLNLSEQTVKNQLSAALKRLREQLSTKSVSDYALISVILFYL